MRCGSSGRPPTTRTTAPRSTGTPGLEVVWTAVPAALVTAITIYSGIVLNQIDTVPKDHRVVEVTGQQFAWSFHYPDSNVTSGVLALPIGQTTELKLQAKDVIHSFWVPEWRMKEDAVPGITTNVLVTPTKEGTFTVICTELCGLGHARHARAGARPLAGRLREMGLGREGQGGRHGVGGGQDALHPAMRLVPHARGRGNAGGGWARISIRCSSGKDADFIHESIVNPNAEIAPGYQPDVMPGTFGDSLTDAQLQSLVEYLVKTAGKS